MSSENPVRRRGRAPTPRRTLEVALRVGQRALTRVAQDTLESYLANQERQEAIERLLIRFGEALKALPEGALTAVNTSITWDKPMRFRDLAAHWYEEGLDHQLIWNVLRYDLPPMLEVISTYLASTK